MATFILVKEQEKYHNRKGGVTQNVLAACALDGLFTYALAGAEGSYNIKGITISDSVTGRKPKEIVNAGNGAIKAPAVAAANVSFWQGPSPRLSGRNLGSPGDIGGRRYDDLEGNAKKAADSWYLD
ncbi:hypothetical protein E4U37_005640 [Claviceps purpurea]|nr:hypothetical protein E4U37_005640 [Claviceps purpurea]